MSEQAINQGSDQNSNPSPGNNTEWLRNRLRADIRRFEGESSGSDDGEEPFGSKRI